MLKNNTLILNLENKAKNILKIIDDCNDISDTVNETDPFFIMNEKGKLIETPIKKDDYDKYGNLKPNSGD